MRVRDLLGVSDRRQRQLARVMELSLVGLLFIGFERGEPGIVVNTSVALAVTKLPAVLERDYGLELDAGLVLWLTAAAFLHAVGTVGVPGAGESFYRSLWWWDHVTHGLSASVVAGAGYVTVRALDRHSDAVRLPPKFTFVFVLLFVLAFGVFWEVVEFAIEIVATTTGTGSVLTQYDLQDTMLDLVFDTIGAVVVAAWGHVYLTDVVGHVHRRLEARRAE